MCIWGVFFVGRGGGGGDVIGMDGGAGGRVDDGGGGDGFSVVVIVVGFVVEGPGLCKQRNRTTVNSSKAP